MLSYLSYIRHIPSISHIPHFTYIPYIPYISEIFPIFLYSLKAEGLHSNTPAVRVSILPAGAGIHLGGRPDCWSVGRPLGRPDSRSDRRTIGLTNGWRCHGTDMELPWQRCGLAMAVLKQYHVHWKDHGRAMAIPWQYHVTAMALLWHVHGIAMTISYHISSLFVMYSCTL